MDARKAPIVECFDGRKQCLIPLFQRPYSWGKKHWDTLWDDITGHCNAPMDGQHFMGAVVTVPARTMPVGVNKFLVIDGQQRLTTVAILLCALRDVLDEANARTARLYLANQDEEGTADYLKLYPTQVDRDAFASLVDGNGVQGGSQVAKAYKYFRGVLRDPEYEAESVFQVVCHTLMVVMITLSEGDDPHLIFESLNAKGQPLTQADLVRNYVLMKFKHSLEPDSDQVRVHRSVWQPLENELGGELEHFLSHYLMRYDPEQKRGTLYSAIRDRLKDANTAEVERELTVMREHADYYGTFLSPAREPCRQVQEGLGHIRDLEVTTVYPILLQCYAYRKAGEITNEEIVAVLSMLESFVVRRAVCEVPTNQLGRVFANWAKDMPSRGLTDWLRARIVEGKGNRRCPTNVDFVSQLRAAPLYRKKVCRFVLERLEQAHGSLEPANLSRATIEHIMPQTLTDEWRATLGEDANALHAKWCDTLGNLALTAHNQSLSNAAFGSKRETYERSHIDLTRGVAGKASWGPEEIQERGAELAGVAAAIWPSPHEGDSTGL